MGGGGAGPALHAIDVVGMGVAAEAENEAFGGWDEPPRTGGLGGQALAYIDSEVGEPCVVAGQSNLCAVALEAAS